MRKLRISAIVLVLVMVFVSFSGAFRGASANGSFAPTANSSAAGASLANGTGLAALAAPTAPSGAMLSALTSPFPPGIFSGQNTYVYNFDASNEGFTKPVDYTYSDVHWDSTNHNIFILSNRADPGDERLVHTAPTLDTAADFTVTARWRATTQGNWQYAFPVFIMSASNTQVLAANSITFYYASRDSNLGYAPWYSMFYYDASGAQHTLATFVAQTNTEYHFFIHYDSLTKLLRMEIRSAADVTLIFGQYRIGSNPNDGFTLGQVGASAHGWSGTQEPTTVAWTDDIAVTYATGSYRDATLDSGDGNVKIGWLADNFNNNANNGWTIESGNPSWAGGVMTLQNNTIVHAGSSWYDQQFQFDATFTASGSLTAEFRVKDSLNLYEFNVIQGSSFLSLCKAVAGSVTCPGGVSMPIALNTPYTFKVVARGNYFEMWAGNVLKWSGTDTAPPSPMAGYIRYQAYTSVKLDNVRVWNTVQGSFDTAVANAGTKVPLSTKVTGTVDAYNQTHVYVRSSANNVAWDNWTLLKSDVAAATSYAFPDQDRQKYYQFRVVLSSGMNGTAFFTTFTTTTGTASTSPTATAGYQPWYVYVGGLVNPVNQNLLYTKQDMAFQGRGFTLAIVRSYNSVNNGISGPLGIGWTFNYNEFLTINGDNSVTWTDGSGSAQTFLPKAIAGTYSPPRGLPDRLIRNADLSFTLSKPDGTREMFTSAGRLSSIADRNGNKLTLTYDANGRLTRIADDAGKAFTVTWNSGINQISQIRDPMGRTVNYTYLSGNGNSLGTATDPMGFVETYSYQSSPTVLGSVTDPLGKVTWFSYTRRTSQVTEIWLESKVGGVMQYQFREYAIAVTTATTRTITNARGFATTLTLGSFGNPTQVVGPTPCRSSTGCSKKCACGDQVGNSTNYVWDGELNKMQLVDGRGDLSSTTFGTRANPLVHADAGGNESVETWFEANTPTSYLVELNSKSTLRGFFSSFTYDSRGNQLRSIDAGGNVTQAAYDANGFLNKTVSPRGYTTWYVYNASGWLVKKTDPMSDAVQYAYDPLGRETSVTDPMGFVTTTKYDSDSRVINVTDPLLHSTTYGFNSRGDLVRMTDPDNLATQYTINVTNSKVQTVLDSGGNSTSYQYDLRENLISFTDANGHTTTIQYDQFDRVSRMTTALQHVTAYTYDASGNPSTRTDGNGATTRYAYDKQNEVVRIVYPPPQTVASAYDMDGDLVSITGFGYTETRTYDGINRLSSATFNFGSFSSTVAYTYDTDGNRATMTLRDTSSNTTTYFYDRADRLTGILDSAGHNTTLSYDRNSRTSSVRDANGIVQTSLYDRAGRLTKIFTNTSGGANVETLSYSYDSAGYLSQAQDTVGSGTTTTTYFYDRVHRLYKTVQGTTTVTDTYDAAGNVLMEVAGITYSYVYDADNELIWGNETPGWSILYGYDNNGNRVSWSNGAHGGYISYGYDYENRLTTTNKGCGASYSPTGEKVVDTCGDGLFQMYDYATPGGSPNLIAEYDSNGVRQDQYIHADQVDTPVEMLQASTYYGYQSDRLGSVTRITDIGGNTVNTYGYDAWGAQTSSTGTLANPFQFTARIPDPALGLYDFRARYYDPSADGGHRFISRDSVGAPSYIYGRDSPTRFVDPTGRCSRCKDGGGGGGGGGGPVSRCTDADRSLINYACDLGMTTIGLACFALGPFAGFACGITVGIVGGIICDALISSYCGDPMRWLSLPCDVIVGEVCMDALKAEADGVGIALGIFLCPILSQVFCGWIH